MDGNAVTDDYLKFHYRRLHIYEALGNLHKSDNNKNKKQRS